MDDFEKELKVGFLEEASQLLADTEQCFLVLESDPSNAETINKIFRLAHSLKGSAKAVGFDDLGSFTHEFESLLLKIKNGEMFITTEIVSLLLRCNDHTGYILGELKADMNARVDSQALMAEIGSYIRGEIPQTPVELPAQFGVFEEAKDIVLQSLALPLAQTTSTPASTPTPTPTTTSTPTPASTPASTDESIRVSLGRLETLLNFVGEMVILQTVMREQLSNSDNHLLRKTCHQLGKVTKEVQDLSMSLRMVPVRQTFQKMQRIVRDTATLLNKKVNLVLEGEDTELDKTVLEKLGDPLVHMIRNAVDHGIENPEQRLAKGKSEVGTVRLSASHQSGKLVIEIRDDGGGIDGQRLLRKAIEKGILKPGTQMTERDSVNLIFAAGFSTKEQVTEVSGRGVGMDVVKSNIDAIKGEVFVETVLGQGSIFKIILPLTLAIIDGMVVSIGEERYVIPLAHVHESYKPLLKDVQQNVGLGETLLLRGENLPLFKLSHLLGRKKGNAQSTDGIAIVVRTQNKAFSVVVDDIIGSQQVVIKKLGSEMSNIKGFSGSAILGDGRPSLILELNELITNGTRRNAA